MSAGECPSLALTLLLGGILCLTKVPLAASNQTFVADRGLLCDPRPNTPTLSITGQASITAVLDLHDGDNCTLPVTKGLQQMAAFVWAVSTANTLNLVPNVTIGLEVFDTCSEEHTSQRAVMSALAEVECGDRYSLGVVSSRLAATPLHSLVEALEVQLQEHTLKEGTPLGVSMARLAARLLSQMNRTEAAVVATNLAELRAFSSAATLSRLCVTWEEVLPAADDIAGLTLDKFSTTGMVVVIGPWDTILPLLTASPRHNISDVYWMLVSSDQPWEAISEDEEVSHLREGTVLMARSRATSDRLEAALSDGQQLDLESWVGREVPGSILHESAELILRVSRQLKAAIAADCGDEICAELRPLSQQNALPEESTTKLEDLVDEEGTEATLTVPPESWILSMEPETRLGVITPGCKIEVLASLQPGASLNAVPQPAPLPPCLTCGQCVNPGVVRTRLWHYFRWQNQVWVATITSFAALGILCAIAVALFIAVRMCKGDVLEGNPTFSFILLAAVVACFVGVLPFCVVGPRLVCTIRELVTCLGHALLLSTMLARALMLATTDDQGFMSHVNGYLQAILWLFIIGVQVGLSAEIWILQSNEHLKMPSPGDPEYGNTLACPSEGTSFLLMLGYDMVLLVLLLLVCPFVARSKRNYREGLFFTIATLLYCVTWLLWVTTYVAAPLWREPITAGGLIASAYVVLLAVFIPRTYLMVSSVARARIASALPCTAPGLHNSSSVLDVNYRSCQALYDSVNTLGVSRVHGDSQGISPRCSPRRVQGVANPNYYAEQPVHSPLNQSHYQVGPEQAVPSMQRPGSAGARSTTSTLMIRGHGTTTGTAMSRGRINAHGSRDRLSPSPENTYERYDSPPSPHKVTRF